MLDALLLSVLRLRIRYQMRNPVMFIVFLGAMITTVIFVWRLYIPHAIISREPIWFVGHVAFWLWFSLLFANFSESLAEGKGKAQAESLKKARSEVVAKKLSHIDNLDNYKKVAANRLMRDDLVLIEAGDVIPADGQVMVGIASIDESAVTGESAPVIRESGGDRDAVIGGTKVLSDFIVVRISADAGESFLDRMIGLVEGARRQKTPNEMALNTMLMGITGIFLLVCFTLFFVSKYSVEQAGSGQCITVTMLIALLVCLIPTTIAGLLSAIGISGMQRLVNANVIATSGRAVEAAGDINILLLDKTGTITIGNRQAVEFFPAPGFTAQEMAQAAEFASLADETPEGKSIVALARAKYGVKESTDQQSEVSFIPFTAETRTSGVMFGSKQILKGAGDAIENVVNRFGGHVAIEVKRQIEDIARKGGTPLLIAQNAQVLGVIYLKDIIKNDIKQRLAELRKMGIKSVMITGDNPLTAAAIANEAGVDDFIAEATPEAKLKYIRKMQEGGELVAMVGDGTNDAPALAQSDVAVAMNSGTQAAKEASNMVDLDSDPTKLIEIVKIGKQLLMTRGALTTFSVSNDLAKYFAIIPAALVGTYPSLKALNVMGLASPLSSILSAVIFNAVIILMLIPLAIKGVTYKPVSAEALLQRNIVIYGVGGVITPFIGIKLIDMLLNFIGLT
ncbi:MAG: potassium-transporting ATPase subunit KdpB [Alphaproteobacteria bacterium]|nr:potassium-transporting ATPase subunit KdpB [Alphaproteobacteria bacterium]